MLCLIYYVLVLRTTYRYGDEYLYIGVKHARESYTVTVVILIRGEYGRKAET